ncbi:single-stranded DNA-binding protein [Thioalkalivibrio sp. ALE16]|uniref:single-stranded DNA-binding protein n=1 Tax=Thioalkalivibrio sp. ALE16 TaxID=1158172 RepID=UPI0009DC4ACB
MSNTKNYFWMLGVLGSHPEQTSREGQHTTVRLVIAQDGPDGTTRWAKIMAFGETANIALSRARKGALVQVQGHLEPRTIEVNGKTISVMGVVADRLDVIRQPASSEASVETPAAEQNPPQSVASQPQSQPAAAPPQGYHHEGCPPQGAYPYQGQPQPYQGQTYPNQGYPQQGQPYPYGYPPQQPGYPPNGYQGYGEPQPQPNQAPPGPAYVDPYANQRPVSSEPQQSAPPAPVVRDGNELRDGKENQQQSSQPSQQPPQPAPNPEPWGKW